MVDDAANKSQIIEVAEVAWESMMPNIKAKMLWTDSATKRGCNSPVSSRALRCRCIDMSATSYCA